jgi:LuxR family transcriptional regulator, maltose regulon positive regulatory protein
VSPNLLATKLYIPTVRKDLVPRPRLVQLLNNAWQQDKKLILVSAPAGYGKTTLITEWLSGLQTKTAWLSLDKTDNDPARFLAYLIAALGQIDGRIGEHTQALLQSQQPLPVELMLTSLVNEITIVPSPFILVLDDYHVIQAMPIHQQLDFLVEHQPPQMHLVIITREDPPLPLARLWAHGRMAEIRQDELRFSQEECSDFLKRQMGLHLSLEDITALERRTEGWIAGLQLAALSMQGCDDLPSFVRAFSGSSHYVLEYLLEEVFERQSAEEQDFLLKTSILVQLCGSLCDVVVGRTGSHVLLDRLEHANLFIIPLDQSRTWYRYHHLFAELLRQRLRSTETFSENELNRRASQWFAAEGLLPEAIQHALAASDWEKAAELLSVHSVTLLRRGELITFLGWIKSLPDDEICKHPQLCRDYGWALCLTGQLDAADLYLGRAESAVQDDEALLGTILVGQAYNLRIRGNYVQAIDRAQRGKALLPQDDHLTQGLAALTLGFAQWNCGNLREAEQAFIEVDRAALLSHNHYARMTALSYIGVIHGVYGKLHRAAELCQQVIQMGEKSPTIAPAHIELGTILCEWNALESASEHIHKGIELSQRMGNWMIQTDGYRMLSLLQLAAGDYNAAEATIQKTHELARLHEVNPLSLLRNAACHVQIALAQNDLATAQFWAEQVTEPADASLLYPQLMLTPVRLLLARKEKEQAAERLTELFEIASQAGWGSAVVEVRTLQALAAATPAEALHFLGEALRLGQPEGFMRIFVDKGEPMKALLERLRSHGGELKGYILTLLAAFGEKGKASAPQPLVEPLSERELEVLKLLAEGLSNAEIAQRLIISVGTVKTHVHSIIDKLGVNSRMQAVALAKELEML